MKTAKQEAIEKAYGEHWQTIKKDVDENGWIKSEDGPIVFEPSIGKI